MKILNQVTEKTLILLTTLTRQNLKHTYPSFLKIWISPHLVRMKKDPMGWDPEQFVIDPPGLNATKRKPTILS